EVIETPVGFKYIGEMMRAHDVLIGGEDSGGISVKGHIPEKDGILANMLLIEMMAYENKPLSIISEDLLNEADLHLCTGRGDLEISQTIQQRLMARMIESPFAQIAGETVSNISQLDGMKFYITPNDWVL